MPSKLNDEIFKKIIKSTNLIAIDLIATSSTNNFLLCERKNHPAKGFWFVPGGRVFKNEKLNKAFYRIVKEELGLTKSDIRSVELLGIYEHIYKENVFNDPTFNTHYIIIAVKIKILNFDKIKLDKQHNKFDFFSIEDILKNKSIHKFTKYYFFLSTF